MSYTTTRSGRRVKKVDYSDTKRSKSNSKSVSIAPTIQNQELKEPEPDNAIAIVEAPPNKKQKISNIKSNDIHKPKKRRRRAIKPKKKKAVHNNNNNNNNDIFDLTSFDDNPKENTDNPNIAHVPPLPDIILPDLPNLNLKASRKRKRKRKLNDIYDDNSGSDSSDSDFEILNNNNNNNKNTKKRKLPSFATKSKSKKTTKTKANKSKKKTKTKVKPEKRRCTTRRGSQKTRDRIMRARHQRLFMINATVINDYEREYAVLGSTGNVYTITIGTLHDCSCPDFVKGNLCKHILFIMIKVLRVNYSDMKVYQKGLLTSELNEVFSNAPQTLFGSHVANQSVRNKYKQSTGDDGDGDVDGHNCNIKRKGISGSDCPVCMEELRDDNSESITWCRAQCGNNLHFECFKKWKSNSDRNGEHVLCMFCRAEWVFGKEDSKLNKKKSKKNINEGYLNLAKEQGVSTVRDTSSYYQSGWSGYGRYRGYRNRWY